MPPNIRGLNLVHPAPESYEGQDSQSLLDGSSQADLAAQLDLLNQLQFESEDSSFSSSFGKEDNYDSAAVNSDLSAPSTSGTTSSHDAASLQFPTTTFNPSFEFDFNPLLGNLDSNPLQQLLQAQLLALSRQGQHQQTADATASPTQTQSTSQQPPAKRARTSGAKATSSSLPPPTPTTESPEAPVATAEEKRRRNTEASARFRMKKKEREAALEIKARELEVKSKELERECESLRRENNWLKGLVVGVTGGSTGIKRPREDE